MTLCSCYLEKKNRGELQIQRSYIRSFTYSWMNSVGLPCIPSREEGSSASLALGGSSEPNIGYVHMPSAWFNSMI